MLVRVVSTIIVDEMYKRVLHVGSLGMAKGRMGSVDCLTDLAGRPDKLSFGVHVAVKVELEIIKVSV